MIAELDYQDKKLQDLVRAELGISAGAAFDSCLPLKGTQIFDHCVGTVRDGGTTYILIGCTFVVDGDTAILNLDLPGAPKPHGTEEEIRKAGLDPKTTRLVGICVNTSRDAARKNEEKIQIVIIPY